MAMRESRSVRTFLSCSVENRSTLHVENALHIVVRSAVKAGPAGSTHFELGI